VSAPDVSARTRQGVFSLLGRQLITFPITFLAGIVLARVLGPTDFGTYATVSFLVMGASVLLDVGLGAIVIQQPEEPTPEQLKSIFTAQLLVFGGATAIVTAIAPWLAGMFNLPADGAWLIRAMALNMLLGTFGTNSTLLLERHLKFGTFAKVDVATILLDRAVTLALAFTGFGAWSFVLGSLSSMATRVALLYKAAPWTLGLALDRAVLRRAMSFGAFMQATNLTSLARDNMNTLLGGPLFGPKQVGYLTWGMSLSQTCSQPLVHIVARVCFPAFARLQDHPEEREKLLTQSLYWLNMASYPVLFLLAAHGSHLVTYVFGEPWRPALIALYAFSFRMMGTNVTSVLVGYLNGTGRSSLGFRIAGVWTVAEWMLAVALATWIGFNGIAAAYAVGVLLPATWLLLIASREVKLDLPRIFGVPLALAVPGAAIAWVMQPLATSLVTFIATVVVSGVVAVGGVLLVERETARSFVAARFARGAAIATTSAPVNDEAPVP
jgi:O-antigen/teichoic acid export membrane protein